MDIIPRTLHQMWLDREVSNNLAPPEKYLQSDEQFVRSFHRLNPEFDYRFWNMDRVQKMFIEHSKQLGKWHKFFDSLVLWIQKCDFARYAILYVYGGVYADLDFTCLRPLKCLMNGRQLLLTFDVRNHQPGKGLADKMGWRDNRESICNGFMGSTAGHPFWSGLMDFIMYRYDHHKPTDVIATTGAAALGTYARRFGFNKPEFYVCNCLILPFRRYKFLDRKHPCVCGSKLSPFVSTSWADGSNWFFESEYTRSLLKEHRSTLMLVLLLLLLVAIAVIIILVWRRRESPDHSKRRMILSDKEKRSQTPPR